MNLGVLKESGEERRVAAMPETVKLLNQLGLDVFIENNAGQGCYISDEDYKAEEAEIVSKQEIFDKCEIILKINAPTDEEVDLLKEGKVFLSLFQPLVNTDLVEKLRSKKVTAFSMDAIPRISRAQTMDVLSSQSTVSGYKAVLLAATHLTKFFPMLTTAAGSIPPAKVLILGAGVAGLQAIATARKLGAVVEAFDTRPAVKEEVQSLGAKFVEVEGAADASDAGGYAVEQTEEFKKKQQQVIQEHAIKSNVVITTAQIPGRTAPLLITKDTVEAMVAGSVIVDLAASTGGNCELTKDNEIIVHKGVTIIGNSNLPSTLPADASRMYGKNVVTFLKEIIIEGKLELNFDDEVVRGTCIVHQGELVSNDKKSKPEPKEEVNAE